MITRHIGLAIAGILAIAGLGGCRKPAPPVAPPTPAPATPTPTPAPAMPAIPRKPLLPAKLFNGLSLQTNLITEESLELASQDRRNADAYQVEITVRARIPRPSLSLEDFSINDPLLPGVFKEFPKLLETASVSPFFKKFYALKVAYIQRELGRLDQILSRHNFYDCETILEWKHPQSGRRALLAVGDMDVNVDGSDGDRNVTIDGSSPFFLPQTSYRWPKQTARINPFLPVQEKKLASLKAQKMNNIGTPERLEEVHNEIALLQRRIFDLKKWSFLIAETDPFIVLPGFMMRDRKDPFTPGIGDFALVIYEGRAYPAIVGDAGPSLKIGEASLLICRELNARSSAAARPVSELKVAYLVFPGTAENKAGPPDLNKWRERCKKYVDEMGGLNVELHSWPNLVKPWPTPTPTPTPSPSPASPTPTPVPPTPTPAETNR